MYLSDISAVLAQGYLFGMVSAFLSALAAVYTEWVMKRNDDSLHWQNIQLYSFGILFNGMGLLFNNISTGVSDPQKGQLISDNILMQLFAKPLPDAAIPLYECG